MGIRISKSSPKPKPLEKLLEFIKLASPSKRTINVSPSLDWYIPPVLIFAESVFVKLKTFKQTDDLDFLSSQPKPNFSKE